MKKRIAAAVNRLIEPFGARIVGRDDGRDDLSMTAMVRRFAGRGIPVRTIVDIGASDGKWSIACMKHFPEAAFLAVEPLEERRAALEAAKNRHANFDYALCVAGEVDGAQVRLNVTTDLDGSTVNGRNPGIERACRARTIDSLLAEKKLPGPYLLKFDTHGYEVLILAGCRGALEDTAAIIMETYNFRLTPDSLRFHEMCARLEEIGFRPADMAEPMLRAHDRAFWQMDLLFLRADAAVFRYDHYR